VALVCQYLEKVLRQEVLGELKVFPPGLDAIYQRIMDQIHRLGDTELCRQILAVLSTVFRPITLAELASFVQTLKDLSDDYESLAEVIRQCGSFLVLRENTLYFIH